MPRPTRYETNTVRRTLFLHPDTDRAITEWCAGGNGRKPGMLVDIWFKRLTDSAGGPEPVAARFRKHDWEPHGAFGRICKACRTPIDKASDTCPGGAQ